MTITATMQAAVREHEITLTTARGGNLLAVSCSCLARPGGNGRMHGLIEARSPFPAAEAIAAWRAWHEERRIEL